jgi:hypothetical protein
VASVVGCAAGDGQLGHRGDRGQRLAAETHGRHRLQLGQAGDLAGGVALQGQRQLRGRDAAAVVLDHDAAHAASQQPHGDLARAGVQRVVDQFAHDGGRPLDHLARGDLAHQLVGQFPDRPGGRGCIHRGGPDRPQGTERPFRAANDGGWMQNIPGLSASP